MYIVLFGFFIGWLMGCQSDDPTPAARMPVFENRTSDLLPVLDLTVNSMDMEAADLNGDGRLDMVIAAEYQPNIILVNDGENGFVNASAGSLPQVNHDSEDIALGDFDQDGDVDIVFVSEDDQINEYYLNDGRGRFSAAPSQLPVTGESNAVLAIDLNGDGALDLLVGNNGQNNALINDGKGAFVDETNARMPQISDVSQDIEAGDVDGDGDLDLVIANEDANRLLLNDGKGVYSEATTGQLPVVADLEETREADLGDVDGDGDLDLFLANVQFQTPRNPNNRLLINDGAGNFLDESETRLKGERGGVTLDGDFVDMDGDGDLDLLVGNSFMGGFQLFVNERGIFTEQSQLLPKTTGNAVDMECLDLNGDGILDIYISSFQDADLLFLGS
jgi:hypothetical protein